MSSKAMYSATVKGREFLGIYTAQLPGYARPMPVLCFSPLSKPRITYSISPFSDEELRKEPLSVEFASLRTPDDFAGFAERHGSLMGFCERKAEAVDPITQEELGVFFDLGNGKKARVSMSAALGAQNVENLVLREFMNDWITAVRLMSLAFSLWRLTDEESLADFITDEQTSRGGTVREYALQTSESEAIRVRIFKDYTGLITDIVDPTYYVETLNPDTLSSDVSALDSPEDRRICVLCPAPSEGKAEETLHRVLVEALDRLINFHLKGVYFEAAGGKMAYSFDSLLSYLWFNALASSSGLIEISTCDYCGKPFLRTNSGKKKRFCCDTHKRNWHNHKTRATKEGQTE